MVLVTYQGSCCGRVVLITTGLIFLATFTWRVNLLSSCYGGFVVAVVLLCYSFFVDNYPVSGLGDTSVNFIFMLKFF